MRAAEQNPKDREVGPRGLTFPIKLRCTSVTDLLSEPGLEAGLARALGRAFARARSALPAPVAVGGGVALQPPYLTGSALANDQASALLVRVRRAIYTAARAQSLPIPAASATGLHARHPKPTEAEIRPPAAVAERFDPSRFDPETGSYEVSSYDRRGRHIAVTARTSARSRPRPGQMAPALGPAIPDEVIDKEPPFEGALVVQLPGNLYVRVRSHRYLTTPNIGHAVTWGYLLFGPTAWVITAHAEPSGAILYYVAALEGPLTAADLRVVPLDPATKRPPGVTGVFFPSNLLVTLPGGYAVQAVFTSDGGHFAPSAKAYAAFGERVEAASKGPQTPFEASVVRAAVFRIIDALLASGSDDDLEKAADNLAELSEAAFSLLDAETRIRYLTALVKAWTNEPQEKAIVEIFKSVGSREELNQIKKKLIEANIWNQLFDDLDSELWSLLIAIGRKFGDSASFSLASLGQLLLEANLIQPLPGVRLNEKGEPELSSEIFAEAYDAARSFVNKVKDFLESLWMFIAHPDKLIDSIGQLTKMIVTVELAQVGYEPAIKAVKEAIAGIAQQALWALKGVAVTGVGPAVERRVKWTIIWEIASWFVGVGEVKAAAEAVGLTERLQALGRLLKLLGIVGEAVESERVATKVETLARLFTRTSKTLTKEEEVLRMISRLPEEDLDSLGHALQKLDIGEATDLAKLMESEPQIAEALHKAEALSEFAVLSGGLSDDVAAAFGRLSRNGKFSHDEILNLLYAAPEGQQSKFIRVIKAIPANAFEPGGEASLAALEVIASSQQRMDAVLEIGWETFAAIRRRAGPDINKFDEYLRALSEMRQKLPPAHRPARFRELLDQIEHGDTAAWQELEETVSAKRAAKPAVKQGSRLPDPQKRVQATATQQRIGGQIAGETSAARASEEALRALRARLRELQANPLPRLPELADELPRALRIENIEEKIEAIRRIQQRPDLSLDAQKYLEWQQELWTTTAEIEDISKGQQAVGRLLERLHTVEAPRAELAVRAASRAVKDFLRTEGPNYRKLSNVNFDQILGEGRWRNLPTKPALATDHLVALDRIANEPELTDFLALYQTAPESIQANMTTDLIALGDKEANLVRMRADANLMKGNKSWHDITYEEAERFGYSKSDVDAMRTREDRSLEEIRQSMRELANRYRRRPDNPSIGGEGGGLTPLSPASSAGSPQGTAPQGGHVYASIAVEPSGKPVAAAVMIPGQKALTPRQAYDFVLAKRGFEQAVPVHQLETVTSRIKALEGRAEQPGSIAALRQRLSERGLSSEAGAQLEKDLADAERELKNLKSALIISVPTGPGGPVGAGYNTYAVIQVIDRNGNLIAWGEGKYSGGPHAEEIAIEELRAKLGDRAISGARIDVVGDREVCPTVCRPAIRKFATDIKATSADGYVYQRPKAIGEGPAREKPTALTATQRSIQEKIEGVHGTVPLTEVHEQIYP